MKNLEEEKKKTAAQKNFFNNSLNQVTAHSVTRLIMAVRVCVAVLLVLAAAALATELTFDMVSEGLGFVSEDVAG